MENNKKEAKRLTISIKIDKVDTFWTFPIVFYNSDTKPVVVENNLKIFSV